MGLGFFFFKYLNMGPIFGLKIPKHGSSFFLKKSLHNMVKMTKIPGACNANPENFEKWVFFFGENT